MSDFLKDLTADAERFGEMRDEERAKETREIWLAGYRFALSNLHQPGVLADAHRYVCEDETDRICPHVTLIETPESLI